MRFWGFEDLVKLLTLRANYTAYIISIRHSILVKGLSKHNNDDNRKDHPSGKKYTTKKAKRINDLCPPSSNGTGRIRKNGPKNVKNPIISKH